MHACTGTDRCLFFPHTLSSKKKDTPPPVLYCHEGSLLVIGGMALAARLVAAADEELTLVSSLTVQKALVDTILYYE